MNETTVTTVKAAIAAAVATMTALWGWFGWLVIAWVLLMLAAARRQPRRGAGPAPRCGRAPGTKAG